jgi:hypothetical protein
MSDEELDALCATCPHKDKINEYGDCSAPWNFSCPQIEAYVREEKEKKMTFMSELLSRCENSDDADKREIAVYVRKLDGMRDVLEEQVFKAQDTSISALKTTDKCLKELHELKDRYRWHSCLEMPTDNTVCVAYIGKTPHVCVYDNEAEVWFGLDGDEIAENVDYWRTLDSPEEESK